MSNKCVFGFAFLILSNCWDIKQLCFFFSGFQHYAFFFRISASHNICDTSCKITFGHFILKMEEIPSFRNLSHGKKTCLWLGFNYFQWFSTVLQFILNLQYERTKELEPLLCPPPLLQNFNHIFPFISCFI